MREMAPTSDVGRGRPVLYITCGNREHPAYSFLHSDMSSLPAMGT